MKKFIRTLIVLGLILGGITLAYFYFAHSGKVSWTREEIVNNTVDTFTPAPEPVKELSAEDKEYEEIMKVKAQEAKLEAKRNVQKEELRIKRDEYDAQIKALQKERDEYVSTKEAEIKATEAELASFIKATALSKN